MENSNLINVLKTLSGKEVRELRKWLCSPAHNHREDVTALFHYLTTNDHLYDPKFLKKERVFGKIFTKETYDDAKLRQTMHFLFKVVEDFLIYQDIKSDEFQARLSLARVYRERKVDKAFNSTLRKLNAFQESFPYRDEIYYRNAFRIHEENQTYYSELENTYLSDMQSFSDAFDNYFIVGKLRLAGLMVTNQKIYKNTFTINLVDEVLQHVEQQGLTNTPAVAIYYHIYQTLTDPENETHFFRLKDAIFKHGELFPQQEIKDIFLMAINYCIRRANTGEEKYYREQFELYRLGFEKKFFVTNDEVDPITFINAVTTALRLQEYRWAENFIKNYHIYIDSKYQRSFYAYALANLRYEQGAYKEAMQLLAQEHFEHMIMHLKAKTMLFKMYFEESEFEPLEPLLDSIRTYINRKEGLGYHKQVYQNFIKYGRKLIKLNPYNREQKQQLTTEIQQVNPLLEKEWFVQQVQLA